LLLRSHFFVGVFSLPGYAGFAGKIVRRALGSRYRSFDSGQNMIRGIHRFISLGFLACAMAATVGLSSDNASTPARKNPAISAPQVASRLMEVRIRRLHLVRPDLIPYPIAYETIC
jgi:hypothetical protein